MKHQKVLPRILERTHDDLPLPLRGEGKRMMLLVSRILEALIREVRELPDGGSLRLQGFGTFQWRARRARQHFNLVTHEVEAVPPRRALTFRPSRGLRSIHEGQHDHPE